jgi:hypothetical protein
MSQPDRRDALLDRQWESSWETLPEAPPLVSREAKSAQITLRLPAHVLAALRAVASRKSLPYHALARSWVLDGLRREQLPDAQLDLAEDEVAGSEQLNLKIEPDALEHLKVVSDRLRRPYHRLARQWIEAALVEEQALAPQQSGPSRPAMKDLMVLLLHATDGPGGGAAVRGITRLQKLLFVIEQKLVADGSRFYAYNFGPYDEQVNDAAQALRVQGLLRGSPAASPAPPSFGEMMAVIKDRRGPRDDTKVVEEFALSNEGHMAAERLRRSNQAYERLYARIGELRREWDRPDLIERVYEAFPKYTERSLIRDAVAQRKKRRRRAAQ